MTGLRGPGSLPTRPTVLRGFAVLHWLAWVVARLVYRLRVIGTDNLPASGPVLILSNHVSYVDWLVLMAASPRPIHFLIDSNFVDSRWYSFILRAVGVIPIDRKVGPKSLMQSFAAVSAALADNRVVCVFPEGAPCAPGRCCRSSAASRSSHKSARSRSCRRTLTSCGAAGSATSTAGCSGAPRTRTVSGDGRIWPRLPNHTPAAQGRQAVLELSAECAIARLPDTLPAHRQFVRIAAAQTKRRCLIDTNANPVRHLNAGEVLAGAICLADWLRPHLQRESMVGVWLPSSVGGALANIALALLGKTRST